MFYAWDTNLNRCTFDGNIAHDGLNTISRLEVRDTFTNQDGARYIETAFIYDVNDKHTVFDAYFNGVRLRLGCHTFTSEDTERIRQWATS